MVCLCEIMVALIKIHTIENGKVVVRRKSMTRPTDGSGRAEFEKFRQAKFVDGSDNLQAM